MASFVSSSPSIISAARQYWSNIASRQGSKAATVQLLGAVWEFVRDSTPSRLRQRFGDADYDWEYRVNTTSGAVGWRERLLGTFHSAYQPTEPEAFHEMMQSLSQQAGTDFSDFTFIDLGSGKGRTLLMASDYPFRRIIGVELLPALHRIARENATKYRSQSQRCFVIEPVCSDAAGFALPGGPLVIFLFNPFYEPVLRQVMTNIDETLRANPRTIYVVYYNPQLDSVITENGAVRKIAAAHQYNIYRSLC